MKKHMRWLGYTTSSSNILQLFKISLLESNNHL